VSTWVMHELFRVAHYTARLASPRGVVSCFESRLQGAALFSRSATQVQFKENIIIKKRYNIRLEDWPHIVTPSDRSEREWATRTRKRLLAEASWSGACGIGAGMRIPLSSPSRTHNPIDGGMELGGAGTVGW